jgi:peptidyl-prolyl cis-trans isomerase C
LGWLPKGSLVKEVEDVAFVVAPGQLSQPVKSGFGWHILFVEDKKPAQERTFDQVKDNVYQYLKAQKQQELTQQMRDSAKVEFPGQVAPSTPAPAAPK